MSELKLLIFDVDGVLRHSATLGCGSMEKGFRENGLDFPFEVSDYKIIRTTSSYNNSRKCITLMLALLRAGKRPWDFLESRDMVRDFDRVVSEHVSEKDNDLIDSIRRTYKQVSYSKEMGDVVYIYPGIKDAIEKLKQKYTLAIWTNSGRVTIERDLKGLGLGNFSHILGGEDFGIKKPSGEGIIRVCRELKIPVEETAYVGDSEADVESARNAGCKSIVILVDTPAGRFLKQLNADYYYKSVPDMAERLLNEAGTEIQDTNLIVVERGGEFLLIKRDNEPQRGCWAFPGGHVDEGEGLLESAQREAREEAGDVELMDREPSFVFLHHVPPGEWRLRSPHIHRCHVFMGRVSGEARAGSDAAEFGWFTFGEADKLRLTNYTKAILYKLNGKPQEWFDVVNEKDEVIGRATREDCHSNPELTHIAVFILVINSKGELLLQKRSMKKDLNPGKWTGSASGHVESGDSYEDTAKRELQEELGVKLPLKEALSFHYKTEKESETAKVFTANSEGPFRPEPEEIDEVRFFNPEEIRKLLRENPDFFTPGCRVLLNELLSSGKLLQESR